jgi:hypothetical protein
MQTPGCRTKVIMSSLLTVSQWRTSRVTRNFEEMLMSLGTILLVILILMLLGVIPTWPHSRNWGYGPAGGLGLVLIIVIVLLLLGRL